jgi:hypothetical protein
MGPKAVVENADRRPAGDADRPSFSSYLGGTGRMTGSPLEKSACHLNVRTAKTWLSRAERSTSDQKLENDPG